MREIFNAALIADLLMSMALLLNAAINLQFFCVNNKTKKAKIKNYGRIIDT